MLKRLVFAGVAGVACGKLYSLARGHPEVVLPILQCSAAAGAVGGIVGWGVAAYRNHPTHIYSISLGANLAIASGVFLGIRQALSAHLAPPTNQPLPLPQTVSYSSPVEHTDNQSGVWSWAGLESVRGAAYVSSMSSGGITGATVSVVSRLGLRSVALTTVGGVMVGACAQFLYDQFEVWRRRKAIQIHYPQLTREDDWQEEEKEQWSWDSLQARFLQFWHQTSRSSVVSAHLSMLEEAIAEEERRMADLDRELRDRGLDLQAVDGERTIVDPPVNDSSSPTVQR